MTAPKDNAVETFPVRPTTHEPLLSWLLGHGPENALGIRPESFWEQLDQFRREVNRVNWEAEEQTKLQVNLAPVFQQQLRVAEKHLLEAFVARYPFLKCASGFKPKTI